MSFRTGDIVCTPERLDIRIGDRISSGGAGVVFRSLDNEQQVIKLYHAGLDISGYERKIRAMLAMSPNLPIIQESGQRIVQLAWPEALVQNRAGRFIGFCMPAIDIKSTCELEFILQERQARKMGLPTGLGHKITLAANLAGVIAALHREGHHVVDLKPVNLRIYPRSLHLALLDCDGFSIAGDGEHFSAPQFTPDYLAPEFQNDGIRVGLEAQQDRFALAAVIFQLLNFGIHPFTGRPTTSDTPTDIAGRIASRCYAYGQRMNASLLPNPTSGHHVMPNELRMLFDRAFAGHEAARPSAAEWADLLRQYAKRSNGRLISCKFNIEHQLFPGHECAACARNKAIAQARLAESQKTLTDRHPRPVRPTVRHQPIPHQPVPTLPPRPTTYHRHPSATRGWLRTIVGILMMWDALLAKLLLGVIVVGGQLLAAPEESGRYSHPTRAERNQQAPSPPRDPFALPLLARDAESNIHHTVRAASESNSFARDRGLQVLEQSAPKQANRPGTARPVDAVSRLDSTQLNEQQRQALIAIYLRLLETDPESAEPAYQLGWLLLHAGRLNDARNQFLRAIWANPRLARAWCGLAVMTINETEVVGALVMARIVAETSGIPKNDCQHYSQDMLIRAGQDVKRYLALEQTANAVAQVALNNLEPIASPKAR